MQRYNILENEIKKCKTSNAAENYQSIYKIIAYAISPLTYEIIWDIEANLAKRKSVNEL